MKKSISNGEIVMILREIGEYLEMRGVPFKPRAYEKAAETVETLREEAADIYGKGGLKALEDIPGVGLSIAEKMEELIKTGRLKYYEELKKKTPVNLAELTKVEGLGPMKIRRLYEKLKIKNLAGLEKAARAGKIAGLEGFGEKSEKNILKGIDFLKKSGGRFVLGFTAPLLKTIEERLRAVKGVKAVQIAGSARRRKETIGDADFLVIAANPKRVMDCFVSMPEVARVLARGGTKSMIQLENGLEADVRVLPEKSYGAALNYFTGSKDHNVKLRELAMRKGWKLNEYGLFQVAELRGKKRGTAQKDKMIAGKNEAEIYETLGLAYIEPELREDAGEIEAALAGRLPKLIGYGDLKGDLQVQTDWSDGENSIEEMALEARRLGLEYIAVTDHTKRLAMARGLDEKRIIAQMKKIDALNAGFEKKGIKFRVLKGTECDILKDGRLDLPDEILKKLDVVGAAVHSYFNLPKKEQTDRLIRAMKNPHVDVVFHPTGRLINRRPAYELDMEAIVKAARETKTVLEIDAFCDRLDLKDVHIRMCVEAGVPLAVDSDAHNLSHFAMLEYGIAQARRGWAAKSDVINAWPLSKMLAWLK